MSTTPINPDAYTLPFQLTKRLHRDIYPAISLETHSHFAEGKVIIVTGASGGLGYTIAKTWATSGAKGVVLVGRSAQKLKEAAADMRGDILFVAADITKETDVTTVFKQAVEKYGGIDVVVNAAGTMNMGAMIGAVEPGAWWRDYEVNVKGLYNLAHGLINAKNGAADKGTLINLVSMGASFLVPGMSSYSTAKLAAVRLGEYLHLEQPNLRTFSIHPGIVEASDAGRGMVIDAFTPFAKDTQGLTAAMTLYLQKSEADFMRGGFVSVNWDVEEMEEHKVEIVEGKLLGLQFLGAKLGPEGHPWAQ